MKSTIFIFIAVLFSSFSFAQNSLISNILLADISNTSKIKWNKTTYDFGTIVKGKPVTFEFEFTNLSNQPVVIMDVKAGCGCTSTNYTNDPVNPSKTAKISATYNAAQTGIFNKSITVTTTAESEPVVLTITGKVVE